MKFKVFWDGTPCSHVEVDRGFRGAYCLHHQGDEQALRERIAGYIGYRLCGLYNPLSFRARLIHRPDDGGSTHL
jgi:hypothetical protein